MMDIITKSKIDNILDAPTCYPERPRKCREKRQEELVYWYETYNEICETYNFWGMDCADSAPIDEWLDRGVFRKQRHDVNAFFYPNGSKFPIDYTVIMRDKRMFEGFAEMVLGYGNKYSPSIGYIIEKQFCSKSNGDFIELIKKYESQMLVFKQVFGCSGETVKVVKINNGIIESDNKKYSPYDFLELLSTPTSNWIIQEFIEQHSVMSGINRTSVNTLRIVTFHIGNMVVSFPVIMLRYGYPGCFVDNSSLSVGIDESGTIMKYASSWSDKSRVKCHVAGIKIPFFEEAVNLAKFMHKHIPEIFTVGWDICITSNGPLLIEGNDGWDNGMYQSIEGCRMRNFYNEMLVKRLRYYNKQ